MTLRRKARGSQKEPVGARKSQKQEPEGRPGRVIRGQKCHKEGQEDEKFELINRKFELIWFHLVFLAFLLAPMTLMTLVTPSAVTFNVPNLHEG